MRGSFPDLTNANFWPTLASLETVEPRTGKGCGGDGYWEAFTGYHIVPVECGLPVSPSDLDILVYYLGGFAF